MAAWKKIAKHVLTLALALALCLSPLGAIPAKAATGTGLEVESVYFREILRSYASDKAGFDSADSAQALANLFTATVGLNYYGEGSPASYFAKDITAKYESDPYIPENLLGSYDVDIHPVNGRAEVSTDGRTWRIHVYLAGYAPADNGVTPIYHYVWQDNGSWWAVRDDVPYYRVSYNGMGAGTAARNGLQLVWSQLGDAGDASSCSWTNLCAETGAAVANGTGATFVAVDGNAAIFAVLDSTGRMQVIGNAVAGRAAVGPVVDQVNISRMDGSAVGVTEELMPGESYRVQLNYVEALRLAQHGGQLSAAAQRESGESCTVADVVWYGSEEYLVRHDYNPHKVEYTLTVTPGSGLCLLTLAGVVGHDTGLRPAAVRRTVDAPVTVTAAAEPTPAVTPTVTATPETPAAPEVPAIPETPVPVSTFAPDSLVTWEAILLRLWQRQGCPCVSGDPGCSDCAEAACWADSIGLCAIWGGSCPANDTALTREQTALVLCCYARQQGLDTTPYADITSRPDCHTVSPWAVDAVRWALGSGILTPAIDGSIAPGATLSHSQLDWMLSLL